MVSFGNNSGSQPGVHVELNQRLVQQQSKAFARLLVDNPDTRKRIRKIINEELKDAVKRMREDIRYELPNDPRKAFRGIKSSLYKKILGGSMSILNPRRAGARYQLNRHRKLDDNPYQRGGNRRKRSARTEQVDSYYGKDRAFILRFLSSGTQNRHTRYGNRGSITARNWFQNMAPHEMQLAAENIAQIVNDELVEAYNELIKQ